MQILSMEQGSPEWFSARAGRITGSIANKLVTPTGKASTTYRSEIGRIIAEAMKWQQPEDDTFSNYWMERGKQLEPEARAYFQIETGMLVKECGFIVHDDLVGFSPDGYIEADDGIIPVEFKCPKPSTHIEYLADYRRNGEAPRAHLPQCHFGMAVCGADHMWFLSYHPEADSILHRVERNEMTELMEKQLAKFRKEYVETWESCIGPYPKSGE